MSKKKKQTVVTVDVAGKPKRIFAVTEGKYGPVVSLSYPKYVLLSDDSGVVTPQLMKEVHLSIHTNPEARETNTITHRFILATDEQFPHMERHVTRAIKANPPRYALVVTHRCEDIRGARYDLSSGNYGGVYNIGEFEPERFQLLYQILACHPSAPKLEHRDTTNAISFDVNDIRLTLLWTFISYPSADFGDTLLLGTYKAEALASIQDQTLKSLLSRMPEGILPEACVDEFTALQPLFIDRLIDQARTRFPNNPEIYFERKERLVRISAAYFQHGTAVSNNPTYELHRRIAEVRMRADPVISLDPEFRKAFGLSP